VRDTTPTSDREFGPGGGSSEPLDPDSYVHLVNSRRDTSYVTTNERLSRDGRRTRRRGPDAGPDARALSYIKHKRKAARTSQRDAKRDRMRSLERSRVRSVFSLTRALSYIKLILNTNEKLRARAEDAKRNRMRSLECVL